MYYLYLVFLTNAMRKRHAAKTGRGRTANAQIGEMNALTCKYLANMHNYK